MTFRSDFNDKLLSIELSDVAVWLDNLGQSGWTDDAIAEAYSKRCIIVSGRVEGHPAVLDAMSSRDFEQAVSYCIDSGVFAEELPDRPESNPYSPLRPYQFWGAVRALGYEQDLKDWVAAVSDPVEKGIASAMLEFSLEFRRDHPLMEAARVALGMSETELDTLWLWGLTL